MPDYSYICDTCEVESTVTKPMAESARPEACATCGAALRRVFVAAPVHFRGSCWSKDNYTRPHVTFKMKDGSSSTVPYKENKLKKEDK